MLIIPNCLNYAYSKSILYFLVRLVYFLVQLGNLAKSLTFRFSFLVLNALNYYSSPNYYVYLCLCQNPDIYLRVSQRCIEQTVEGVE